MVVDKINTNGYFINQTLLNNLKLLGCHPLMKISFDGLSYHNWMREEGAEEVTLKAIKLCFLKVIIQS